MLTEKCGCPFTAEKCDGAGEILRSEKVICTTPRVDPIVGWDFRIRYVLEGPVLP